METAKDRAIWDHAKDIGACIVTRDEDFVLLAAEADVGPSVVSVRIGNAVRRVLLQRLSPVWPVVVSKLQSGEQVVEIK